MPFHARFDEDIEILRITSQDEATRWRAGFIGAYQTVFSDDPYFERIQPSEAEGVWKKLTSTAGNITLLAVRQKAQVIAFAIAIPLRHKPDVMRQLTGLVPVPNSYYLAELGVLHDFRTLGLGRSLIRHRLDLIDKNTYSHVILRVAASRNKSYDLYRSMGFEDMGVYMEVPAVRIDGRVTTDRRLFLCCVISQVRDSGSAR
jgi:ribosomal protein S18 acetylase RimI-like enzyme